VNVRRRDLNRANDSHFLLRDNGLVPFGWTPIQTLKVYAHALPADDQRAADTWDGVLDGPVQ
jgi:hypothetical protein